LRNASDTSGAVYVCDMEVGTQLYAARRPLEWQRGHEFGAAIPSAQERSGIRFMQKLTEHRKVDAFLTSIDPARYTAGSRVVTGAIWHKPSMKGRPSSRVGCCMTGREGRS
jgi:hypothetical protein